MIISMFPAGGSGSGSGGEIIDGWNYTGDAEYIDDGNGNWRIKFLSSGILSLAHNVNVDIFAVGGGSGGFEGKTGEVRIYDPFSGYEAYKTYYECGGGGSGGSVAMLEGKTLESNYAYEIVIGEGGAQNSPGGETKINGIISANGGKVTHYNEYKSGTVEGGESFTGAWGGTGGGAGDYDTWEPRSAEPHEIQVWRDGGNGGSNGGNGSGWGLGMGQGDSTREFGETGGTLYAGGGAGGSLSATIYQGGSGGGGNGASTSQAATNGAPNTGSGGGGGCYSVNGGAAGSGGSGILIIRNARGE